MIKKMNLKILLTEDKFIQFRKKVQLIELLAKFYSKKKVLTN